MKDATEKILFSNGARVQLQKLEDGKYGWVVVSFEDDTYLDGEMVYPSSVFSDKKEDMMAYECHACGEIYPRHFMDCRLETCQSCLGAK